MTREEAMKKLETDIQLRGMSPHTVKEYRDREKDIAPATINNYNSALRFFFEVTLVQTLCYRRIPRKKDPLSTFAFEDLCTYFKEYKPSHPEGYLFLNGKDGLGNNPISERAIQDAFKRYHKRGRIPTDGSPHTLRHSYATHLMEDGVNVFYIQKILGHATL